jgi:hypothetical protein
MILIDSSSEIIAPNHKILFQSKHCLEGYHTIQRTQRLRQPSVTTGIKPRTGPLLIAILTIMFLNRCCYGDISGILHLMGARRYESMIRSHLKRRIFQSSCGTNDQLRSGQNRYSVCDESSRPYCTLPQQSRSLTLPRSSHSLAFIISPSKAHYHQQQAFASTQTKPPRSANRWRSPILRPPVAPPGSKRPPKLFKRLHNIRGKKNSNDDEVSTIVDDGKLYRADRVLANRTGRSRKECFQLLQERRVFMVTDQLYNEVSPKQLKDVAAKNPALALDQRSTSNDQVTENVDAVSETEDSGNKKRDSTSIVQQYRLEVITGPAIKIGMHTKLRIDKYQDVPLPPPLLMVYHKPKVSDQIYRMDQAAVRQMHQIAVQHLTRISGLNQFFFIIFSGYCLSVGIQ